jgi:hypothetical protein
MDPETYQLIYDVATVAVIFVLCMWGLTRI